MFFQIGSLGREIFQIKYRIYTIQIMYINICHISAAWIYTDAKYPRLGHPSESGHKLHIVRHKGRCADIYIYIY